jgi:hypothetical protein
VERERVAAYLFHRDGGPLPFSATMYANGASSPPAAVFKHAGLSCFAHAITASAARRHGKGPC